MGNSTQDTYDPASGRTSEVPSFNALMEEIQTGVWLMDADFTTVYANRCMSGILGLEPGRMLGRRLFYFMDATEATVCRRMLEGNPEGAAGTHELPLRRSDGEYRIVALRFRPLFDDHGRLRQWAVTCQDITEDRHERQLLREREDVLWSILDRLDEAVVVLDHDGRLLEANPAAHRLLGLGAAGGNDASGASLLGALLHRELGRPIRRDAGFSLETRLPNADGGFFHAEIRCTPVRRGFRNILMAVVRDVTEQVRLRSKFETASHALDRVGDLCDAPMANLDSDGRVLQVNPALERWTGETADMLVGRNAKDIFGPESEAPLSKALKGLAAGRRIDAHGVASRPGGGGAKRMDFIPILSDTAAERGVLILLGPAA